MLGLLAAAVFLTACGGGGEEETTEPLLDRWRGIVVTLDGPYSAENVGLLMAENLNYFDDVDLGVEIRDEPVTPERPVWYVAERSVDLAISHQPQVVLAEEEGLPITAVGSLVSEPTAAMIWLKKSKIDGIAGLKGKTIGIYGLGFERALLQSILARAGLTLDDVKVKKVEYETVPDLVSGRIDAIFGNSGNVEGAELESRGLQPVVTPVQDLGVPAYDELVVIARPDRLREDPRLAHDFMAAVARGTTAAIEDPKAAAAAIAQASETSNKRAVEATVEATLPLLSRSGEMNPEQETELVDWMRGEGLIS